MKIASARSVYEDSGRSLLRDEKLSEMLLRLDGNIQATHDEMRATGIVNECADCAVQGEGTCCSERTGHKCDMPLLLINLLLGRSLPAEPQSRDLCYFLSNQGCVLRARPIICINFVCRRLRENIPHNVIVHLQQTAGEEMDLLFRIEEYVKLRVY
ncbi:MAG TPA: hypothetical protein VK435_12125 [Thermodesulfovibrionales bacterium]|nr:hypothetical protein [Thermodesulfovibrionales bacterium]